MITLSNTHKLFGEPHAWCWKRVVRSGNTSLFDIYFISSLLFAIKWVCKCGFFFCSIQTLWKEYERLSPHHQRRRYCCRRWQQIFTISHTKYVISILFLYVFLCVVCVCFVLAVDFLPFSWRWLFCWKLSLDLHFSLNTKWCGFLFRFFVISLAVEHKPTDKSTVLKIESLVAWTRYNSMCVLLW